MVRLFPASSLTAATTGVLLAAAALLATSGCAPAAAFEDRFPDAYAEYEAAPSYKALAFARDRRGSYAYGVGRGAASERKAAERALLECRARQRAYHVEAPCEIIRVGNRRVGQ